MGIGSTTIWALHTVGDGVSPAEPAFACQCPACGTRTASVAPRGSLPPTTVYGHQSNNVALGSKDYCSFGQYCVRFGVEPRPRPPLTPNENAHYQNAQNAHYQGSLLLIHCPWPLANDQRSSSRRFEASLCCAVLSINFQVILHKFGCVGLSASRPGSASQASSASSARQASRPATPDGICQPAPPAAPAPPAVLHVKLYV